MGVRKRVLKLFKTLYSATSDRMRRIDMCNRIVQRMGDEDDTVKDLAMKTLEELWFTDTLGSSAQSAIPPIDSDKSHLLMKVSIIMGTAACFKDRNSPLEDLLHKLITQKERIKELEKQQLHPTEGHARGSPTITPPWGQVSQKCDKTRPTPKLKGRENDK